MVYKKGHTPSEETKRKIGLKNKGKKHTEEQNKKKSERMIGRKLTEKTKQKMRETHKRIGTGKWNKDKKWSKERKEKTSKRVKEEYIVGKRFSWNKNKKDCFTEKSRKRMSESGIKRWDKIGRKKRKRYFHKVNKKYTQWRNDVFIKDNWTCQNKDCNKNKCYLEAHHIKSWAKYPELRYEVKNGVSLCRECHKLTRKKTFIKH